MTNNEIQHNDLATKQMRRPPRRKVVDLRFEQHTSFGEWIYNSTASIIAVLILVVGLAFTFTFLTFSIDKHPVEVYLVELPAIEEEVPTYEDLERARLEKERLEREIQEQIRQQVRNTQSNEAITTEDGGMEGEVFDAETREMMSHVDGLLHSSEPTSGGSGTHNTGSGGNSKGHGGGQGGNGEGGQGNNFKGAVTVEYKFENPVRVADGQLYAPAYRAEHSGRVVIEAEINRNGEVIRAKVHTSSGIKQLDDEALKAAKNKRTKFQINDSAPSMHRGTITYIFIAP